MTSGLSTAAEPFGVGRANSGAEVRSRWTDEAITEESIFTREAREYMRAYAREAGLFGWVGEEERLAGHQQIEKFVKTARTHRCTLDQEWAFVTSGGMA